MEPEEAIVLPPPTPTAPRAPLPLLAAVVPVASGVVLFAVTGSVLSLSFAALGPLMILASFVDGMRQRRRSARRARAEESVAWERAEAAVAAAVEAHRQRRERTAPDLAGCLSEAPLRRINLDTGAEVTLGRADAPSPVRFSGSGDRADAFRAQHRTVSGMPLTVALGTGVCIRGPGPIVEAVARALVLQLCLRHAHAAIRLDGDGIGRLGLGELAQVHERAAGATTVHVGVRHAVAVGPRLVLTASGAEPPAGFETVIDVAEPALAEVRSTGGMRLCAVSGISADQGAAVVAALIDAAQTQARIPDELGLRDALDGHGTQDGDGVGPSPAPAAPGEGLVACLGRAAAGPVVVDLVSDGPHALVTGVTGAGKSELLVSWVTALAARYPVREVGFVLADFKGGTAFEPLRVLPHVAAVITDLDADGARRGVGSLRAELRRREQALAAQGARSITECDGSLGRLVIVVDEFAALLQEHPDLAAVFTDIAARGRALGMHLILGTQRATGVVRDALATNCPLRIALRVTDTADSRVMIGTDQAAELPGDETGRGLALLRRPRDGAPVPFRVARTTPADLAWVLGLVGGQARAVSPWLPPLPRQVLRAHLAVPGDGEVVLGVADEPQEQRQRTRTMRVGADRGLTVFGGPGAGKSSALRGIAEQVPGAVWIPQDPEHAWSMIDALADGRAALPPLLVVDDVDRHLAAFPLEYASAWAERLQRVIRMAPQRAATVVLSATRCSAQTATCTDLLPSRAILGMSGRTEHIAVGGDPHLFDAHRAPGRASLDGTEVHFALPDRSGAEAPAPSVPTWEPHAALVAVVSTTPARTAETLAQRFGGQAVQLLGDGAGPDLVEPAPDGRDAARPVLRVGDAECWQRQYALWQRIRRDGEVVVLAEAARELRVLAGVRELPPYAVPFAGRAWVIGPDGRPSRVGLIPPPRA